MPYHAKIVLAGLARLRLINGNNESINPYLVGAVCNRDQPRQRLGPGVCAGSEAVIADAISSHGCFRYSPAGAGSLGKKPEGWAAWVRHRQCMARVQAT